MAVGGKTGDHTGRIRPGGRVFLVLLPGLLVPSCWAVFHFGARLLGPAAGYPAGFAFYWLVWCLGVPLALLGRRNLAGLFAEERPLFSRANVLPAALLVSTSLVTLVLYTLPALGTADWGLFLVHLPLTVLNGVLEEVLWRGLYLRAFPDNCWLGVLYPALGFAAWHLAPQAVYPSPLGIWAFAALTLPLGLVYGWAAKRSGSIRWPAASHALNGVLVLGDPLARGLLKLLKGWS
jgi:membrane protease YdiL (CAAX protease family)